MNCLLSSYHAASPECSNDTSSTPLAPTATTTTQAPSIDVDASLPVTGGEVVTLVFIAVLLLFAGSVSIAAAKLHRRPKHEGFSREDVSR